MVWYPLMSRLYPPKPIPGDTNYLSAATNSADTNAVAQAATSSPASPPSLVQAPRAEWEYAGEPEQLLTVANDECRYVFTTHGGGIKFIELLHYPESIRTRRQARGETNNLASLNTDAPLPVLAIMDGRTTPGDGVFRLTKAADGVRAEKHLTNGLYLVKDFKLSSNFLVQASVRFENRSTQSLSLPPQEWATGAATPMGPIDKGMFVAMMWYNGVRTEEINEAWFANRTLGCLPGTPRTEYLAGDGATNIVWTAVHNQFFTLAAMPQSGAPRLVARQIHLPPPSAAELAANPQTATKPMGIETSLVYPGAVLQPNQSIERRFVLYAGPKEYNTLAKLGIQFGNNLDLVMGFGGFFGFFAKALLLSMNGLHNFLGVSYGIAIIAITVIIKVVFWPLTNASTRSMKRMAALQPQMNQLREKYKDDPKKMNSRLMEFMKENKVSPMGGCLPMLLQIPVFFGFYRMLQSAIELRGAQFLWAADLSSPDTVWYLPGLHFPVNPLPLIMGVTMLWQSHLTPPSPGVDPMQQKMMKYMPLMFIVFLYNFSAGLSLYWTVQNLLSILQTKITKMGPTTSTGAPPKPATPYINLLGKGKKKK